MEERGEREEREEMEEGGCVWGVCVEGYRVLQKPQKALMANAKMVRASAVPMSGRLPAAQGWTVCMAYCESLQIL
jgi:hypothetical protein